MGYDSLTDSDVMDIIDEAKGRNVPCGQQELIEDGLERGDNEHAKAI